MTRRLAVVWLVSVPLMLAGTQVAHVFAYRLVYPEAQLRLRELLATGHSYMGYLPLLLGLFGALELVAFFLVFLDRADGRRAPVPAWAFACLPPLAFALQEFLERWLRGGQFPWWMVQQPTFRVGLLLQLPFALLAYVFARLLLRAAAEVARLLGRKVSPPRPAGRPRVGRAPAPVPLPRLSLLALGWTERGPPLLPV